MRPILGLLERIAGPAMRWGLALALVGTLAAQPAHAQGVDLTAFELSRDDGALVLEFAARLTLSRAVEDALQRGVPMYFVAEASVYRSRWYWRDERVAHVVRNWRLSFQPLTSAWRVSLGGLSQTYASLSEALAVVSRAGGWRLVEGGVLDADSRHYVEFSYRLDTSQLPRPMQIGVGGEWQLGVERSQRVE
jgi:Domain of unknown function (DUF4390)